MDRIGLDTAVAAVVALWFLLDGLVALFSPPTPVGRRVASVEPVRVRVGRRIRGVLDVLAGLAVAAGAAIDVVGLRITFPGRAAGLVMAALAVWGAVEAARPPGVRWLRLALSAIGFNLALFYAGFRG